MQQSRNIHSNPYIPTIQINNEKKEKIKEKRQEECSQKVKKHSDGDFF